MYIEPNIAILKRTMIAGTLVLIVAFAWYFVATRASSARPDAKVIGVSGELTKEDGVLLVNGQTVVRGEQPLDGLIGRSVAVVGVLDENGILHIEQVTVAPEEQAGEPVSIARGPRITAQSDISFTALVPEGWTTSDTSQPKHAQIMVKNENNIIELHRAEELEAPDYATVESDELNINGFPFLKQRVILAGNNRPSDVVVPSEACVRETSCPKFWAINQEANPESTMALESIIATVTFFPEPQGWKLFTHALVGSEWNMKLLYPEEMSLAQKGNTFALQKARISEITMEMRDGLSGEQDTWGGLRTVRVRLPTRSETVAIDKDGSKTMILIAPDEIGEVKISGSGATFDAVIRTIVFEKKS